VVNKKDKDLLFMDPTIGGKIKIIYRTFILPFLIVPCIIVPVLIKPLL
jgi:hypothetical protein